MSIVGFKAQNHPQQTGKRGAKDAVDDRGTDPAEFAKIDAEFGPFTLDVAASAVNTKCERFFSIDDDGLAQSWAGERVWCNPPYSNIGAWVQKAWAEREGTHGIVMLLPANRCEQKWWQEHVEPYRDRDPEFRVRFLPGRMRFIKAGSTSVGPNERPPFGCCLLIWPDNWRARMRREGRI
jgi:phage N-6-adenine-methyltransferase